MIDHRNGRSISQMSVLSLQAQQQLGREIDEKREAIERGMVAASDRLLDGGA